MYEHGEAAGLLSGHQVGGHAAQAVEGPTCWWCSAHKGRAVTQGFIRLVRLVYDHRSCEPAGLASSQ